MKYSKTLAMTMIATALTACSGNETILSDDSPISDLNVDSLAVVVPADAQREYSFTDKKSAFWYGKTHTNDWDDWYAGWNIAKRRLLSDYALRVDTSWLDRSHSQATVYPYKIERRYDKARESLYLVDDMEVLFIELSDITGDSVSIELSPRLLSAGRLTDHGVDFTPNEAREGRINLLPFNDVPYRWDGHRLHVPKQAGGFILSYTQGSTPSDSLALEFRRSHRKLLQERITRLNDLIEHFNPLSSDNPVLDHAMAWLLLTTDQLVTRQQGNGIYAGLPWFNEYWGRDMFISMPGAILCTGQWASARSILSDFAKFQDSNPSSPTYGRIPNRANLEGIIYNTVDGTPRFVIDIYQYLCYTGDTEFLASIYPAVALSTNAAVEHQIDENGYLLHDDADTWMDAKRQGKYPCSPRGNRANDIQALWYGQLRCAASMARLMNHSEDASRWDATADKLSRAFNRDFVNRTDGCIYDHLNADGSPDKQFRPNAIYTYDLVPEEALRQKITRDTWDKLVYPWGVASLDQNDPQFHPYHENWHHYHKDDAYHNGTVWLWNNGMAMQRMIESGQQDIAWLLFDNMDRQALYQGAVGSLSENADAWPLDGAKWARRSGTFLQAWSNAEQIRVWYQGFLGILPMMLQESIGISPRIPSSIDRLRYSQAIGKGRLEGAFNRTPDSRIYAYRAINLSAKLILNIENFRQVEITVTPGTTIQLEAKGDALQLSAYNDKGDALSQTTVRLDSEKVARQQKADEYFKGTRFAQPSMRHDLPSLSRYFDPPLDYSSIE